MTAPLHRCLAVGVLATSAAAVALAWLVPVALTAATGFDQALVRLCAGVGAVATAWLWLVSLLVLVEARHQRWRAPGVPVAVRRALLAACGAVVVAGLAAPAGAAGRQHEPQTALSVVSAAIAGLPLPDRPHGPAHARPARDVVTVEAGDSLWSIAAERLGAGDRWPEIYALNRAAVGPDPDVIRPAQRLRLPFDTQERR